MTRPGRTFNDLTRSVKAAMGSAYADLEARNWRAITTAFGLPMALPDCVKVADERIYANEKQALFGLTPPEWGAGVGEPFRDILIRDRRSFFGRNAGRGAARRLRRILA
jgi:hypothetical protein